MSSYLLCIVFIAFRALPAAAQLAGQSESILPNVGAVVELFKHHIPKLTDLH